MVFVAYNWVEACKRSSHSKTAEARFCDWAIDNPLFSKAIEKTLSDFVSIEESSQQLIDCAMHGLKRLRCWAAEAEDRDGDDQANLDFLHFIQ